MSWSALRSRLPSNRILVVIGLVAVAAVMATTVVAYSALELARFARAELARSTVVYASGQSLAPGTHVGQVALAATLAHLGYAETRTRPAEPGQFQRTAAAWEIVLRGQEETGVTRGSRLRLVTEGDRVARVLRDGRDVGSAVLEAEVLTGGGVRPGEEYRPLRLSETPRLLINAVLAAEDRRFFEHGPVDPTSLARAAWANVRSGRVAQGGSTITQQLVKTRLLTPQRTMLRKVQEAWLALLVEYRYPKNQILEAYLNEIYLGQRDSQAIRGMGAAARVYFGKEVHQLTTGEAAALAGMVRAPNIYSPAADLEKSRIRRNAVLARMREVGVIGVDEYNRARTEPMRVVAWSASGLSAPYFVDAVRQELEQRFDDSDLRGRPNVRIATSLDLVLQRFAEQAMARGLDRLETTTPRVRQTKGSPGLQAALVAIDPATGEIRALVGGRDYRTSQFNRALLAHRQPGSAFKPFVYATALHPKNGRPRFTAASIVDDSPVTIQVSTGSWTPRNYEDRYEGPVTLRRALEQSLNTATVRIAQAVGPDDVLATAQAFGLGDNSSAVPSIALGAFEVTPIELARAYTPFANGGLRAGAVTAVRAVQLGNGRVSPPTSHAEPVRVISPAEAYVMTALLQGVIRSGTGAASQGSSVFGDVAGKTGTTNEGRDAWFVGYSPRLLTVVWVGFDNGQPHGMSGAQAALPIWADFMRQAQAAYGARPFTVPEGVSFVDIDVTNGKRANGYCRLVAREVFLTGTEPGVCEEHGGVTQRVVEWWERLYGWLRH
jgi:penicillin-binding protein 1B